MIKTVGLILLTLLQILGWFLLVLFLVLFVLLLLVLFVPVRYQLFVQNERIMDGQGKNPLKKLQAQATVCWFLHFIHVSADYGPKGLHTAVRLAGIDLKKVSAWFSRRKAARQGRSTDITESMPDADMDTMDTMDTANHTASFEMDTPETDADRENLKNPMELGPQEEPVVPETDTDRENPKNPMELEPQEEPVVPETDTDRENPKNPMELGPQEEPVVPETDAGMENRKSPMELEAESVVLETDGESLKYGKNKEIEPVMERVRRTRVSDAKQGRKQKKHSRQRKTFRKKNRNKKNRKFRNRDQKKLQKTENIRTKLHRIRQEFTDETNRSAVGRLWLELCRILRSYMPGKFKADITFSLADPALTGGVLGLVSLMPQVYRYPCTIVPDFASDSFYIEGELILKGKVTVAVFLSSMMRLILDKEFRKAARRLMGRNRQAQKG